MCKPRLFVILASVAWAAAAARADQVPRPSPDFAIKMLDGKPISVSQYRGKVVALAFILTYCPHCQKTVGYLSAMQKQYGPRGFQALASAVEDMAAMALPDFLKRFNPPFPVGFDNRNPVLEYLQHPAMLKMMMPQVVFIDRQGVIRAQYAGDDKFFGDDQEKNLRNQIESLLKEDVPPPKKKRHRSAHKRAS
jgi:peroxiredoxin